MMMTKENKNMQVHAAYAFCMFWHILLMHAYFTIHTKMSNNQVKTDIVFIKSNFSLIPEEMNKQIKRIETEQRFEMCRICPYYVELNAG